MEINIDENMNLCQLGFSIGKGAKKRKVEFSCMGCCGHEFKSKGEIENDLDSNMKRISACKSSDELKELASSNKDLAKSGICKSLVFSKDRKKVFCYFHKEQLENDLRDEECNREYMCRTFKEFLKWDDRQKKDFISFLMGKKPDWHEYSMKIDSDAYLKEFLENKVK